MVPSSFQYNEKLDTIDIGGHNLVKSKKFCGVASNRGAAFLVDDVAAAWGRGAWEGGEEVNAAFDTELIRLRPARILGWGIDTAPTAPTAGPSAARRK